MTASGVDKYSVDLDLLKTFYACSRYRSDREAWDKLHDETELVAREVVRYVDTGQRSIVDKYLSQAQVEEARTNQQLLQVPHGLDDQAPRPADRPARGART